VGVVRLRGAAAGRVVGAVAGVAGRWVGAGRIVGAAAGTILIAGCASGSGHSVSTSGIPRTLLLQARPIGRGAAFHPPATGPTIGPCTGRLGQRDGVHVELFADNRVVLVAAGIGTRPPLRYFSGRIAGAGCYGDLVTLDPTGLVLVRPEAKLSVGALFRAWGQPLSRDRMAGFSSPGGVVAFVNGRAWRGAAAGVPLRRHWEIVLEVGPHVPPHSSYMFPPGT
jgi:hypothetical protein